ncbi:ribosomal protein S6 kinase-like 1 isoform X14 [Homo sapiens]|uniref:ribosomal protein S6 kinase-like 1 isoform X14 n=1 Tax=Homo sapiens TaxID=9606 RepID=UPI0023E042E0|nr:ribosomal protein S6 kinase-like 1 isoform X14 [Homo sapiens]
MSLVACECLPSPGLEPEPCSQARSQAHVYLEQIRNRVALGVPDMTKRDYLVDAATQIRLALERDVSEDYEAAFNHYQNGVDVLLRGIHVDPNKERREAVKLKITKYLRRAEEIFNCHLQRLLSSGASPSAVQLVQDPATGGTFVVKSLPRCHMVSRERLTIIPHGVPYMTKLLRYFVSEDSIFLHLEHVQEVGGISELTEACDWWSFGSLLYELLTGMALSQSHPSGIQAHTQLQLPEWLSRPAASLLTELLQFEPTRRLGMGEGGVSKLKSHPFFSTIQWSKLVGALVLLSGTHFPPVTDLHRGMASLQELSRQGLWKRQGCV